MLSFPLPSYRRSAWAGLIALALFSGNAASAAEPLPETFTTFFNTYCIDCHDTETAKGDFHIDFLKEVETPTDAEYWQLTLDNLHLGEMPPEKKKQPSAAEIEAITTWIEDRLAGAATKLRGHTGEVVLRRLNRTEYEHTIEDLFDVRGDFAEGFPEDAKEDGFDNIGAALMMSAEQLDSYFAATDFILDRAIVTTDRPETKSVWFTLRDIRQREEEKRKEREAREKEKGYTPTKTELERQKKAKESGNYGSPYFPDHGEEDALIAVKYTKPSTQDDFRVREPGWYRFAFAGYAVRSPDKPVRVQVVHGSANKEEIPTIADVVQLVEGEASSHEYRVYLQPNQRVWLELVDGTNWLPGSRILESEDVAAAIRFIEIEGPLIDQWPPRGHRLLLGEREADSFSDDEMPNIIGDLAPHLFRRPVAESVVHDYANFYQSMRVANEAPLSAFKLTVKAMMASPLFLYHVEPGESPDAYALANRLSYFLWRSSPDAKLLQLAASGKLTEPETLKAEVERLLADDKAERFLADFVGQWLKVDLVGEMQPDSKLYPEYDPQLEMAMVEETRTFVREMLEKDEPLSNLIDSDWAMLNDRLAEHYGIPGVAGNHFRRVSLDKTKTVRGGLLTQASLLNVTSNGTTTSPVVRGVFVLDHLLGNPAPPPPPDVPPIEPDIRGATTIQEQLEKHREIAQCASCHQKIDPYGIALENFDVIGGWRENYRALDPSNNPKYPKLVDGKPVSASDTIPRLGAFADFREFRQLLLQDEGLVYENLAHKLATYALGRKMDFADEPDLRAIATDTKGSGGGMRTMIHGLVASELFRRP
ncbi:MAG: DUF1592 domain-containing protein [Verrucomicrobiae bacterium]|nr:DUF1592 domain-containing protein [Verrucomicrobiae bacterium]